MTVQPVDATVRDNAIHALAEITALTPSRDLDDPALAQVLDLGLKREKTHAPTAADTTAAKARLVRAERQRATEFCRVCDEAYITDVAWSIAPIRQRLSWGRLKMRRQGPDQMCTGCVSSAQTRMDQVIADYRHDIFALVRHDPTAKKVTAPPSRHDANGGAARTSALSPRRQTYDDLIAEDPRSAALTAYAEVASSLPAAPGRWILDGICGDADDLDFFALTAAKAAEAKQRCLSCPVLTPCLDYALRTPNGASDGVWGGMSKKARKALRAEVRRDATAALGPTVPDFGTNTATA